MRKFLFLYFGLVLISCGIEGKGQTFKGLKFKENINLYIYIFLNYRTNRRV